MADSSAIDPTHTGSQEKHMSTANAPLQSDHFDAMRQVRNGADVYSYGIAACLREVQRRWPHWIQIGKPQMYDGDGTDQVPYFGAILTDAGKTALRVRTSRAA